MRTPSAPLVSASITRLGWTMPEHITRIMRMLGGYWMRETPAKSAPAYEHQLQQNDPNLQGMVHQPADSPFRDDQHHDCFAQKGQPGSPVENVGDRPPRLPDMGQLEYGRRDSQNGRDDQRVAKASGSDRSSILYMRRRHGGMLNRQSD